MSASREWWLSLATYAEERDSWSPSYRARVDSKLRVPDGAEQRVRRSDGSELTATWEETSRGKFWRGPDGEPLDDVTHVHLGSRGESGPGGSTDLVPCRLYLSQDERDYQYAVAKAAGLSWSAWARRKLAT